MHEVETFHSSNVDNPGLVKQYFLLGKKYFVAYMPFFFNY